MIDAVAHSKRLDRTAMVNRILGEWADERLREAQCIQRVTRVNPSVRKITDS